MSKVELAQMLMRALIREFPTGLGFVDYEEEFGTIDVDWVDGSAWQIDLTLRECSAGEKKWRAID